MLRKIGNAASDTIAWFVGSWLCVGLHIIWFSLWFVLGEDINLLTLIVSLEAIFLCTLLLMSANRQAEKDRRTAQRDYETDIKAEQLVEGIGQHLDQQDHLIISILEHMQIEVESGLPKYSIQEIKQRNMEIIRKVDTLTQIPAWAMKEPGN